jgi:hypothetical protein
MALKRKIPNVLSGVRQLLSRQPVKLLAEMTVETIPLRMVFLQKLVVTQLMKSFPDFIVPESLLPCSPDPAIGPCPEPVESSPHLHALFL